MFFSAADGPVLPLSFSLGEDRGHAHSGGARNRRMAARIARSIGPVTAEEREASMMCLNHSCDPNVGIAGQIVYRARRAIAAGQSRPGKS